MGQLADLRQEKFCMEYLKSGVASKAALLAGYSPKTAKSQACRLLTRVDIKNRMEELMTPITNKNIADIEEIMTFLTSSMRGQVMDDVVVIEATGDYCTQARLLQKPLAHAGRLKAGELLGKARRMFTDPVDVSGSVVVTFDSDDNVPD